MNKATHEQTKYHNSRLILSCIYERGEVSRADLARQTGLTRPTVSSIVNELIDSNLVIEIGPGESTGGKRPTILTINSDGYQLLCVDLGNDEFRGAVVNLEGELTGRISFSTEGRTGENAVLLVYKLIELLISQASAPLLGIGIATPGLVDLEKGVVLQAVNLGWIDIPLKEKLESKFNMPVYLANDSHMAAWAEYMYGEFHSSKNLIVMKVGKGIGAGIILNGDLFYGDGFGAGEVGHLVVEEEGSLCTCGNRGCLETVASTLAILRYAQETVEKKPVSLLTRTNEIIWETVRNAFEAGDKPTYEIVEKAGKYLGRAIAILMVSYDIHNIAIDGLVSDFGDYLLSIIRREVSKFVFPKLAEKTHIHYVEIGPNTVILGSSAMVLKNELGLF